MARPAFVMIVHAEALPAQGGRTGRVAVCMGWLFMSHGVCCAARTSQAGVRILPKQHPQRNGALAQDAAPAVRIQQGRQLAVHRLDVVPHVLRYAQGLVRCCDDAWRSGSHCRPYVIALYWDAPHYSTHHVGDLVPAFPLMSQTLVGSPQDIATARLLGFS